MPATAAPSSSHRRWRSVALPSEHGGWGLTFEPILLGLLLAYSAGGVALGVAAFVAFLARTPLRVVLVDRYRGRWLDRSRRALGVLGVEVSAIGALGIVALWTSGAGWLVPVVASTPLVAAGVWYDMRSRSRRLLPEVSATVGIGVAAAAIVVAGGETGRLAGGAWLIVAARAVASVPFVRSQVNRVHGRPPVVGQSDAAQIAAVALAVAAVGLDRRLLGGLAAIVSVAATQTVLARRTPRSIKRLGLGQMMLGLAVVAATSIVALA